MRCQGIRLDSGGVPLEYIDILKALFFLSIGIVVVSVVVSLIKMLFRNSPKLAQTIAVLVVGAVLTGTGWWLISRAISLRRASQNERRAEGERARTRRRKTQDAMEVLITTSHAVRDWKTTLCTRDYASSILTSDLQDALVRTDNRAVLITGSLEDMRAQDAEYVLTISSNFCRDADLRFELVTSGDEARLVLAHRSDSPQYYAIAARISSIEKAVAGSDNGDSVFVARGRCEDLAFTGFDGFSIDVEEILHKSR